MCAGPDLLAKGACKGLRTTCRVRTLGLMATKNSSAETERRAGHDAEAEDTRNPGIWQQGAFSGGSRACAVQDLT